jgi:uncharacterized protein
MKENKRRDDTKPLAAPEPFHCERCGNCCLGEGFVSVSDEECQRIADLLGMPLAHFLAIYTHHELGYERWLTDGIGDDVPCIFLERDEKGLASCRIQNAKPEQCRTFPREWRREGFTEWCAGMRPRKAKHGKSRR